jgi:hypothetical protein
MKKLKVFAFLCIMLGLTASAVNAQAVIVKDATWWWFTGHETYVSTETQSVATPSGNLLVKLTFQLDLDDPLVLEKSVNKLWIGIWYWSEVTGWLWVEDAQVIITPAGMAKFIFRVNGAGNVTPPQK